ncbi:MAG: hypothetical protein KGI26_05280 [Thaumarchaeota archaeon]|nr:hypothetical protein [Nitrososphaerota archaeon]
MTTPTEDPGTAPETMDWYLETQVAAPGVHTPGGIRGSRATSLPAGTTAVVDSAYTVPLGKRRTTWFTATVPGPTSTASSPAWPVE